MNNSQPVLKTQLRMLHRRLIFTTTIANARRCRVGEMECLKILRPSTISCKSEDDFLRDPIKRNEVTVPLLNADRRRGCFIQTEAKRLRDTFSSRSTNSQLQTIVVDVDVDVVVVDESILQGDSSCMMDGSFSQTLTTKPLQSRSARYPYRFRKVLTGIMAEPPSGSRVSNSHTYIIVWTRF